MPATATVIDTPDALLHQLLETPEGRADPYPLYRRLRQVAPLSRRQADGLWYAAGFGDCRQLLTSPGCGRRPPPPAGEGPSEGRTSMLTAAPADHQRLRSLVHPYFTPGRLGALRTRIAELADRQLDLIGSREEVDAIEELAVPLSLAVAGELVGIPPEDRPYCWELVATTIAADHPRPEDAEIQASRQAGEALVTYLAALIESRRAIPADDLVSDLVARCDEHRQLSGNEVLAMVNLVFVAGFLPTIDLIGNGLLALLCHPGELGHLRRDLGLVPSAVEEMLRFDPPVQTTGRTPHEPVALGGQVLGAGETVVLLLGAANRDPQRFSHPEQFQVRRPDNQPLSFGGGAHHCLGAGLARLEAQILFSRLLQRFTVVELLGDDPPRRPSFDQRSLEALPVRVVPA